MATVYEIVQGLSQAASNAYDGALGEDQRMTDISKRLKKEYKRITGESVTLTVEGEVDIFAENSSRVRSWVTAKKHFKVGGLDEAMNDDNSGNANPVEKSWETFLGQGGWNGTGGKRPDNDSRKKDKGPQS